MATEDETGNRENEGGPGLGGSAEQSKKGQKDRESANPDGTKGNRKEMSSGESSEKVGESRQGTQKNKEDRNKDTGNPENSDGAVSKKVRVTNARRKLAEIDKRTAEYKARLIEAMMIENEKDSLHEVPRDERKTSRGGTGQGDKGSDREGTPSKRRKERENSPGMEAEKAANPLATDSRASRLPTSAAVSRGCEGIWSLRERVLGWFDPEGTAKTRGGQKTSKEGPDTSVAGEASSSEGGLRKIVPSLARALNKNQGYIADAKKKLMFDGANITEFLIDYENQVALLKWTEEEKVKHLRQHVSLRLERDIIVIVAASWSWKETRDVMMRKYLAAEKMATEADLAAVQRKNFAMYKNFLREFTLVALRIPGVTDRIMSKYFLKQFSEFDKDKILSAYQQTSKFVNTRDVDFSTVTDLVEKTVVTETLTLLKEGEIIDLIGRMGDKMQVTPMGFTNAMAEAQRRMLTVAGDMFPEKCESYIDDNPIKGAQEKDETEVQPGIRRFAWDHLQDIKDLLRRFLVYNITASGPKSIRAVPEVTILGFHCGAYGRKPDPAKTDKISQWPTPLRMTTEVRAFLGVVGFLRIFIKNFAKIVEPIRAMIREEGTMNLTEEREGVVQRLKDILTVETVALSVPCFNDEVGRPFILETDGGPLVVGGVLIQRDEVRK
ncbi:hypothetical protein CBR_g32032 [Chara braunii]|uniref:Reverse transcriptase/retrotransposon-derived protein RNase H-like domain-containing protein n=1 Tax=Chara braunii TaxID=69332 RepID=A0A388LGD3_CHABU|nr:hypothetical protein CBR_g32032 [Chara braunii]|eukprot:GBG81359.1 hypothetical protein CBR_g32032 [Chara braunii]